MNYSNYRNVSIIVSLTIAVVLQWIASPIAAQSAIYSSRSLHHPIVAENGMVASQHPEATKVGLEILKQGGNAVDAAVAVGFSLAVVLPRAGNIGGGGFMLVHDNASKTTNAINYREMAPKKADRDMFLNEDGDVDNQVANFSYKSTGVPGTVAGMAMALEKYGTMSLAKVLAPAIELAENGFVVTHDLARILKSVERRLKKWPASAKIFYKADGSFYEAGEILKQKDLAQTLRLIAENGADGFYKGITAKKMAKAMKSNNGLITKKDMANYKADHTDVIWGDYRGYQIASMPPPSSGGVHVIQMLNILEDYPLGELGFNAAQGIHYMTEAMKLAYADRSKHLGDPYFWDVPTEEIISKSYADHLRNKIDDIQTTPSSEIAPGNPADYESEETTHFSVVDKKGNVVSNTYTLNFSFGNGAVAEGTGILLNNEMDDFSAKPGVPNAFGLLGAEANAIEAGKRPLSSMTPTMVFKDGNPFLVTGSPGGSRIITTVLQVILNVIDHGMNVAEASHAPRIHHQWQPDKLYYEKYGLSPDTRNVLELLKHELVERNAMGSTQSIIIRDNLLFGASDPRRPDGTTMGY